MTSDHAPGAVRTNGGDANSGRGNHRGGNFYTRIPLYLRIMVGLAIGVVLGTILLQASQGLDGALPAIKERAMWIQRTMRGLDVTASMLLRLLGAIAPPLILVAVVRALITAEIHGRLAGRLIFLLSLNTLVAVIVGLTVANVVQPGRHGHVGSGSPTTAPVKEFDFLQMFVDQVPRDIVSPVISQPPYINVNPIGVILIAIAIGIAARGLPAAQKAFTLNIVDIAFTLTIQVLHWVIQVVPLAVLAKVAYIIGDKGYSPFKALGWFIGAVLLALLIQASYYLIRIKLGSWISPVKLIRGTRDALVMSFSTSSSTATMPVTYECLKDRVGLREQSASLGALVGSNFNNDGTALYEAMSALFIAQLIGQDLSVVHQVLIVITSVIAGCGAAGIPEAGLVTMTLVFNAVGLPISYIALLLPVDWFLDRCRTMINVMGDMNVSCLLDGKTRLAKTSEQVAEAPTSP